jgi:metal-responsive CopG/Arc/MetJ family transcriptional regulator
LTDEKQKSVGIPESLYERVAKAIPATGFQSVEDYVTQAVRDKLAQDENAREPAYTKEEEEKVKERLRALGYL